MPPGVYDKDGFKPGPNGGVFPDTTANLTDNKDYENWDWKQIRAAVVGYAATANVPTSTPGADPNSIRKASVVFNRARAALEYVSDNVRLQTEALAGENGAWKSPAADAFRGMNLLFAAKLNAKAEQINGGEAVGTNNVPAQLWESGNYLQWAQQTIQWIDGYYADYVRSVGVTMGDGLARVSDYPELVTQMGEDMKKVVRILAAQYVVNTNSVTPPNPADFNVKPKPPGSGGNGPPDLTKTPPDLTKTPPPGGGGGGTPPPSIDIPKPPGGGGGGGTPPPLNVAPPPGGTGGGGGTGTGQPNTKLAVPPPPALDIGGGPGGGGGGAGGGANGGINTPPPLNVPPPPGGIGGGPGGGGANGGIKTPPPLNVSAPPGSGKGGSGGTGGIKPPPSLAVNAPPGSGGTGGGTGGSGTGSIKPPSLDVNGPPGSEGGGSGTGNGAAKPPSLPNPVDFQAPGSGAGGPGTDKGGAGSGMPMMPPGGAGGGQPGGSGTDRPDSSGLLGGVKKPWEAGSPPPVGDPSVFKPPVVKPEDWAAPPGALKPPALDIQGPGSGSGGAGSGMPMMPPGGAGGGQPGGAGSDRPDSSGLLGGVDKPWGAGSPSPIGGPSEVAPPLVKPEEWAAPPGAGANAPGVQVPGGAGSGMPMMPPGGAGGGQPGGAGSDRPDSSGLLGGVDKPWEGLTPPVIGDPSGGVSPPVVKPENWAAAPGVQVPGGGLPPLGSLTGSLQPPVSSAIPPGTTTPGQQALGGGAQSPMMPPGGAVGGQPGAGAERPDSSGLLGGLNEPWAGSGDAGKIGGNSDLMPPSAKPESWANMPADAAGAPAAPQSGAPLIPPPMAPGAGTPSAGAVPPDASALLGGGTSAWEPALPPMGTDQVGSTPAAPSAPWAVTPGEQVVALPTDTESVPVLPLETVLDPQVGAVTPETPAEVDLTPAAAPAGWAASSDVVPSAPGVPTTASTAAVLGASAVTAASVSAMTPSVPGVPAPPPGATPTGPSGTGTTGPGTTGPGTTQPHGTEFPHVDGDGYVDDNRDEDRAGGGLVLQGGQGPTPGIDRVAVVRPDDAAPNTSAWDTGTADFLLPGVVMPLVVAKSDKSSWETEETTLDIVLKSSEPWEPAIEHATYRRRKGGEAYTVVDSFVAPLSCGDEYSIAEDEREEYLAIMNRPEPEEEEEDPDAEPEETSAADLLNESGSAWGGSRASRPSGVLE